jgi:hypothetical protein
MHKCKCIKYAQIQWKFFHNFASHSRADMHTQWAYLCNMTQAETQN